MQELRTSQRTESRGHPRPRERGVALLLTLGMLSLFLILAMAFAFQARTSKMSSAVNADVTRARLLCESGLERVAAYLYFTFDESSIPDDYYPATSPKNMLSL